MKIFLVKSRFFKTFMAVPVLCLAIACEDVTGYKDSPVDGYVSPKNFSVSGCKSTTRGLFEDETIEYKARENGLLRRMVYYVLRTITLFSSAPLYGFMQK